jgi:dTDP-4-dehydrorhamnose reductase
VAIAEEAGTLGLLPGGVDVAAIKTTDYAAAALRPAFSVLDTSALASILGCAPSHWRRVLRTVLSEMKHA